jgi:hypothetical protein
MPYVHLSEENFQERDLEKAQFGGSHPNSSKASDAAVAAAACFL